MELNFQRNKTEEEISDFIAEEINKHLKLGKKVLLFLSGGSFIPVEILLSKKIITPAPDKLIITLVDERYGDVDYEESNWFKLKNGGFDVMGAEIITFLNGKDILKTTNDIAQRLADELEKVDYKVGLFGMGPDGHTAGILPNTEAISSNDLVFAYEVPPFKRLTITPKVISTFDEAFLYAFGETKQPMLEKLKLDNISIGEQPVQILKKIPLLTIFTN